MSETLIHNDIRTLRFHVGAMTQQELADRIDVTRVFQYEAAETKQG